MAKAAPNTADRLNREGRWLGRFLLAVHEGTQTGFYEALAELTEAVVGREGAAEPAPAS